MQEQYTKGIVLRRDWSGDRDASVVVYTKAFGKIRVVIRGVQRISSKLLMHTVPGAFITARIVLRKNGGFQLVESFSEGRSDISEKTFVFLYSVDKLFQFEECDDVVWDLVVSVIKGDLRVEEAYRPLLEMLGFDPTYATCALCDAQPVAHFFPDDIVFLCGSCFNKEVTHNEEGISF